MLKAHRHIADNCDRKGVEETNVEYMPCQRMSLNYATNMKRNSGESGLYTIECNLSIFFSHFISFTSMSFETTEQSSIKAKTKISYTERETLSNIESDSICCCPKTYKLSYISLAFFFVCVSTMSSCICVRLFSMQRHNLPK